LDALFTLDHHPFLLIAFQITIHIVGSAEWKWKWKAGNTCILHSIKSKDLK
jgi:hypothetical protein